MISNYSCKWHGDYHKSTYQFQDIFIELKMNFIYGNSIQLAFFLLSSLFVIYKLSNVLKLKNYFTILSIAIILGAREYLYIYFMEAYRNKSLFINCLNGEKIVTVWAFRGILTEKSIDGTIKDIIVIGFYSIVLKMYDFWDCVYLEKIEFIYNSDYEFEKVEIKELAFEY